MKEPSTHGNDHLISVIIPVYNGEKYLAEAIESVLSQAYRPFEIIVVDDGSTDRTAKIAHSYLEVKYLFQANQGVAAARNTGIIAACGDFITFLDSDDLMLTCSISRRVDYLVQNPEIYCLISMHRTFLEPGINKPPWLRNEHLIENQFGFGYLMAKKIFLEKVGNFDPRYRTMENMDMFYRAKDLGYQIAKLSEVTVLRRIHNSNLSGNLIAARANLLNTAKVSIEHQRELQKKKTSHD